MVKAKHEAKVVFRKKNRLMQQMMQSEPMKGKTERNKGAWGMPWLSEAKKDVTSCEKPGRGANTH